MKYFILIATLIYSGMLPFVSFAQISGCTDPQANNYNPQATKNNGSCTYNITVYNPPFRFILPSEVDETSGLLFFKGGYWTMNDSGGEPVLYKLDTITGTVIQRIRLSNATNVDWEDLAQDVEHVYIGDFGNNSGNRNDLCIYIVNKKDIPINGDANLNAGKINFTYEDYRRGDIKKRKENNFDEEAFIAVDDSLYLFSKDWQDQRTRMYRLPKTEGTDTARLLYNFNSTGLITGADYNAANNEITLIGYTKGNWIPFLWILFDYGGHRFFSGNKRRIDMLNVTATQTEGIAYISNKKGVISSEGHTLFKQTMYNFSTAHWTDKQATAASNKEIGKFRIKLSPNPLKKSKLTVTLIRQLHENFQLSVYNNSGHLIKEKRYKINRKQGKVKIKLKLPKLKSGIYFVKISSSNGTLEKKFVKE